MNKIQVEKLKRQAEELLGKFFCLVVDNNQILYGPYRLLEIAFNKEEDKIIVRYQFDDRAYSNQQSIKNKNVNILPSAFNEQKTNSTNKSVY